MVDAVDRPQQGLPVNQSMNQIEMRLAVDRKQQKEKDEPYRITVKADCGDPIPGEQPEVKNFVCRPEGSSGYAAPENIVQHLVAEHELLAFFHEPDIKLSICSMTLLFNQNEVETPNISHINI
jgi:hypothetical protein